MEEIHFSHLKKPREQITKEESNARRQEMIGSALLVIEQTIERVKMGLVTPMLLANPDHMAKVLSGTQYQPCLKLVDDFIRRRDYIVQERRTPLTDNGLLNLIDYLQRHSSMINLFPSYMEKLTLEDRNFIYTFKRLFKISEQHLQINSKKEIKKERNLHKLYQKNEGIKANIEKLVTRLASQKLRFRWKMAAKSTYLQICIDQMNKKKQANDIRIQNESDKCQRIIKENQKTCLEKQALLETELKDLRVKYENQAKEIEIADRKARKKKNKLQLQLEAIIKKYDHTICERREQYLDIENDLNKAQKSLDFLMISYRQEEAIYNEFVKSRDDEERDIKQERISRYTMNRAVSIIKRYWQKWRKSKEKLRKKHRAQLKKSKKKSFT